MVMPYNPAIGRFVVIASKEDTFIKWTQKVVITPGWFAEAGNTYPPRPGTVMKPLINGDRAFASVYEALDGAKKSIDILIWGFSPDLQLTRPEGERLGDLIIRKARAGVQIRILVWDSFFIDGGSVVKNPGVKIKKDTDKAKLDALIYSRQWFKGIGNVEGVRILWRGFTTWQRIKRVGAQYSNNNRGILRTLALSAAPSHHQKTIIVDYESPRDAIGFMMGHNLTNEYWDNDEHAFTSSLRGDTKPFHDLSCRVYGPILYDMQHNFSRAWTEKGDEWFTLSKMPDSGESQKRLPEDFYEPAKTRGKVHMAQVCLTDLEQNDFSIKTIYDTAIHNAREYIYFENQYFRYTDFARDIRKMVNDLKGAGWPRELHIFVVTNLPTFDGRKATFPMLDTLGKGHLMPKYKAKAEKKRKKKEARAREKARENAREKARENANETDNAEIAKAEDETPITPMELDGLNVHICTLEASTSAASLKSSGFLSSLGDTLGLSDADDSGYKYRPIYVHSKLLLVDDTFFTLGSANVNVRSMENDSEINIASPAPEVTREWREDLWRMHTKVKSEKNMKKEFKLWKEIMTNNKQNKNDKKPLEGSLVEFFTDKNTWIKVD